MEDRDCLRDAGSSIDYLKVAVTLVHDSTPSGVSSEYGPQRFPFPGDEDTRIAFLEEIWEEMIRACPPYRPSSPSFTLLDLAEHMRFLRNTLPEKFSSSEGCRIEQDMHLIVGHTSLQIEGLELHHSIEKKTREAKLLLSYPLAFIRIRDAYKAHKQAQKLPFGDDCAIFCLSVLITWHKTVFALSGAYETQCYSCTSKLCKLEARSSEAYQCLERFSEHAEDHAPQRSMARSIDQINVLNGALEDFREALLSSSSHHFEAEIGRVMDEANRLREVLAEGDQEVLAESHESNQLWQWWKAAIFFGLDDFSGFFSRLRKVLKDTGDILSYGDSETMENLGKKLLASLTIEQIYDSERCDFPEILKSFHPPVTRGFWERTLESRLLEPLRLYKVVRRIKASLRAATGAHEPCTKARGKEMQRSFPCLGTIADESTPTKAGTITGDLDLRRLSRTREGIRRALLEGCRNPCTSPSSAAESSNVPLSVNGGPETTPDTEGLKQLYEGLYEGSEKYMDLPEAVQERLFRRTVQTLQNRLSMKSAAELLDAYLGRHHQRYMGRLGAWLPFLPNFSLKSFQSVWLFLLLAFLLTAYLGTWGVFAGGLLVWLCMVTGRLMWDAASENRRYRKYPKLIWSQMLPSFMVPMFLLLTPFALSDDMMKYVYRGIMNTKDMAINICVFLFFSLFAIWKLQGPREPVKNVFTVASIAWPQSFAISFFCSMLLHHPPDKPILDGWVLQRISWQADLFSLGKTTLSVYPLASLAFSVFCLFAAVFLEGFYRKN